jgi:hypothetical protein
MMGPSGWCRLEDTAQRGSNGKHDDSADRSSYTFKSLFILSRAYTSPALSNAVLHNPIQSNPVLQKGVCKPMSSQIYTCCLRHATDSQKHFAPIDQSYQSIVRQSTSGPKATRRTALIFRNKKIYKRHGCPISRRRKTPYTTLALQPSKPFFPCLLCTEFLYKNILCGKVTKMYD